MYIDQPEVSNLQTIEVITKYVGALGLDDVFVTAYFFVGKIAHFESVPLEFTGLCGIDHKILLQILRSYYEYYRSHII